MRLRWWLFASPGHAGHDRDDRDDHAHDGLAAEQPRGHHARLPEVELRAPEHAIGRNTRSAMQSGLMLGEAARIDGLLDAIMDELDADAEVVLTGAQADALAPLLHYGVHVDGTLTLRGLFYLWRRNAR